jgi:ribosomal protein S18 acetylase RimI-like enzyme
MNIIEATKYDKDDVVNILCGSFYSDPHIKYIVGDGSNKEKRYRRLMSYAFEQARANGMVTLSENRQAAAVWRRYNSSNMTLPLLIESILFFYFYGISGMKRIRDMEQLVHSAYPKEKSFLYLWLLGTLPKSQGLGYASALLHPVIEKGQAEQEDIYLETSKKENIAYYSKKGFNVYNTFNFGNNNEIELSLMRKVAGN